MGIRMTRPLESKVTFKASDLEPPRGGVMLSYGMDEMRHSLSRQAKEANVVIDWSTFTVAPAPAEGPAELTGVTYPAEDLRLFIGTVEAHPIQED